METAESYWTIETRTVGIYGTLATVTLKVWRGKDTTVSIEGKLCVVMGKDRDKFVDELQELIERYAI